MSRKKQRVRYELDSGDIRSLTIEEIKVNACFLKNRLGN